MKEYKIVHTEASPEKYNVSNSTDPHDHLYIPARAAMAVAAENARGISSLLVVKHHPDFGEYYDLLGKTTIGRPLERLETVGENYSLDKNIKAELLGTLRELSGDTTEYVPYEVTSEYEGWVGILEREGKGITYGDIATQERLGDKGKYHPRIDQPHIPGLAELHDLPFPRGFVAQNKEEIHQAAYFLQSERCVLKPIYGAGGEFISFASSAADIDAYEMPVDPRTGQLMPIVVQEMLDIEKDSHGNELLFSVHYSDGRLMPGLTRQRMHGVEWIGNTLSSEIPHELVAAGTRIGRHFLETMRPRGDGGIDLAAVREPSGRQGLRILEVNARSTGAHNPRKFIEGFMYRAPAVVTEKIKPQDLSAHEAYGVLSTHHMSGKNSTIIFDRERQQGVYPAVWLKDTWGMLISAAETEDAALRQIYEAKNALAGA